MCWICKIEKIEKFCGSHKDLDKLLRKYFNPKYEYNEVFSKIGYYDKKNLEGE